MRRLRRLERRASPELAREVEELSRAYHQEVAFGCSHDVLNLVHAIQHGLRELSGELERRRVPKKVWQETLERADRRSQIVKGIAESMRAFAKQQVPAVRRVGLRRAVEEALDVVADRYAATGGASAVRAIVRVPTHLRVEVPRDRLLQALINLLQNAYEAIRGDGVVWVEAELRATQVVLYLADTGCGIRPEDQALVFFPGKSTKKGRRESEHNTGWGLSLARKFVEEDCRGELTLDSQRGEGTTVTLTLPLRRPEEDA
ncbi:MAG: sensor histidine kinase [Planctomycetota bacterium]